MAMEGRQMINKQNTNKWIRIFNGDTPNKVKEDDAVEGNCGVGEDFYFILVG